MGCGASTLDPEDLNHHNNHRRRHRVVQPVTDEPHRTAPSLSKDEGVFSFHVNTKHEVPNSGKEEVGVREMNKGGHAKPTSVNIGRSEVDTTERDDAFKGPASPSFREYCNNSRYPGSMEDSIDDSDSGESTDNIGNDDSTMCNISKPPKNSNPKKEPEKKERKGRKFRDVINKGRSGSKKMNFGRHRSASKSYADGSRNRVGKVA